MDTTTEKPIPKQAEGMRRVTSEEFFKWIGKKDVHPRILNRWSDSVGYGLPARRTLATGRTKVEEIEGFDGCGAAIA